MANPQDELDALKAQVAALTARLQAVEQRIGIPAPAFPAAPFAGGVPPPPPPGLPPLHAQAPIPAAVPQKPQVSFEKKVGSWAGRIGIVAMLFAVASFLVYAFQNKLIGPTAQVAIGLMIGIGLIAWSERFRNRGYKPFSYSLKAVGIGTLYLSFWAAYQAYDHPLINSYTAFAAMLLVTAATIAMALAQDTQLLAFFALIGGFVTPLLLSSGTDQHTVLFSYITVLDVAILVLAMLRPWRRLLWGSFIGTLILGLGWGSRYYVLHDRPVATVFTIVFAVIFAAIPVATPFKKSSRFPGPSISLTLLPLLNAAIFFLTVYGMYENDKAMLTWFALGLAVVYLGLSAVFRRRFPDSDTRAIDLLHVAIAIAFITIAIPLKLSLNGQGHWITMGWLIESAVLLWIGVQTANAFLRYLATTTLALGILRLLFNLNEYIVPRPIFNSRFATYVIAIIILGGIIYFGKRHAPNSRVFPCIAGIALNLLALVAMSNEAYSYYNKPVYETQSQIVYHPPSRNEYATDAEREAADARYEKQVEEQEIAQGKIREARAVKERFTYSAIYLGYGALLMVVGFRNRSSFVRWQALILLAFTVGKIFIYDMKELEGFYRILSFFALAVVLFAVSFVYQRDLLKLSSQSGQEPKEPAKEGI